MTKNQRIIEMIGTLQCAMDNDADNLHDMGWEEKLDCMELTRDDGTDVELDDAYTEAMNLVNDACSTIIANLK